MAKFKVKCSICGKPAKIHSQLTWVDFEVLHNKGGDDEFGDWDACFDETRDVKNFCAACFRNEQDRRVNRIR